MDPTTGMLIGIALALTAGTAVYCWLQKYTNRPPMRRDPRSFFSL